MDGMIFVIFLVLVSAYLFMRINSLQNHVESMEAELRRRSWDDEPKSDSQLRDLTYRKTFASF